MSNLDPKVASLLDKGRPNPDEDADEDALIAALEEGDDAGTDAELARFRERRLQQLHAELARERQLRGAAHGTYAEIKDEKAVMDITTGTRLCVVHFFKPDFNRCRIMDGHLAALAPKHFDTRFLSINVDNAPFLGTKLKVQVLPCVLAFIDGACVDRIVGFEGLGYSSDNFTTLDLEARLLRSKVLVRSKVHDDDSVNDARHVRGKERNADADELDDDDWD